MSNTTVTYHERYRELTESVASLRAERAAVSALIIEQGLKADREIGDELSAAAERSRQALADLDAQIREAEAVKRRLDAELDSGSDEVDELELFRADTTLRRLAGKRRTAATEVQKAERAAKPFSADDHLALLAAETIQSLVNCPVLVRKRAKDVEGIEPAVILSQTEPTQGYGTVTANGRVRFSAIGEVGLDAEEVEEALRATGSDVAVFGDVIEFETACWPVPRLVEPSLTAVTEFARTLERVYGGVVAGPTSGRTYSSYSTRWETVSTSLEVPEPGKAVGKLVAHFGVEREYPPVEQMRHFMQEALRHFAPGVHTSAGVLEEIELVDVVESGPWVADGDVFMAHRRYDGKFGASLRLHFGYVPVEEV